MRRALILGIGGQDGSYLADVLLGQGCEVHGLHRHSSVDNLRRIDRVRDRVTLHPGDVTDDSLGRVIRRVRPTEIYNEADQDCPGWSFQDPLYSMEVTAKAVFNLLEAVREIDPTIKVFQPVSSTMFGDSPPPQNEDTRINPQSPYAVAKAASWHTARYYRTVHGLRVWTGILYNHDSPRRNRGYLLQDMARACVRIARGTETRLRVGNPRMIVDVGYARDYMEGVVKMMQATEPDDFVFSSGRPMSIGEIAERTLKLVGAEAEIVVDPSLMRPGPQPTLFGDNEKSRRTFGFDPWTSFDSLMQLILEACWKEER